MDDMLIYLYFQRNMLVPMSVYSWLMCQVRILSYIYVSQIFLFLFLLCLLVTRLTPYEITRRQHGAYTSDALSMMNEYNYFGGFSLSEQDAEELASRLQIGKSIITFNADRLRGICCFLLALHESFRRNFLIEKDIALKEPTLNSKQMAMTLEFYLQIDGQSSCRHLIS